MYISAHVQLSTRSSDYTSQKGPRWAGPTRPQGMDAVFTGDRTSDLALLLTEKCVRTWCSEAHAGRYSVQPALFLPGVWGYQAPAGVFSWGSGCRGSPSRGPGSAGGPGGAYPAPEDLYQQVGGQHMRRLLEADG